MWVIRWLSWPVLALLAVPSAFAEIVGVSPAGFELRYAMHVPAAPDKAYAALIIPARWWNAEHTFSQDAANLSLEAKAGGCFCEKLPDGGSVEHMRTVWAAPGRALRLRGALGPFQGMAVDGVMTFTIKPATGGSDVTLSYAIGGYSPRGFEGLAKVADEVLAAQFASLRVLLGG
jgi:uncharacterized protein YndB with AHSA1/START domain